MIISRIKFAETFAHPEKNDNEKGQIKDDIVTIGIADAEGGNEFAAAVFSGNELFVNSLHLRLVVSYSKFLRQDGTFDYEGAKRMFLDTFKEGQTIDENHPLYGVNLHSIAVSDVSDYDYLELQNGNTMRTRRIWTFGNNAKDIARADIARGLKRQTYIGKHDE